MTGQKRLHLVLYSGEMMRKYGDLLLLILGIVLIWKGVTGNILKSPLGNEVFSRWMYIGGGIILLACSAFLFFLTV